MSVSCLHCRTRNGWNGNPFTLSSTGSQEILSVCHARSLHLRQITGGGSQVETYKSRREIIYQAFSQPDWEASCLRQPSGDESLIYIDDSTGYQTWNRERSTRCGMISIYWRRAQTRGRWWWCRGRLEKSSLHVAILKPCRCHEAQQLRSGSSTLISCKEAHGHTSFPGLSSKCSPGSEPVLRPDWDHGLALHSAS